MTFQYSLISPPETGTSPRSSIWSEPAFLSAIAELHDLNVYQLICTKGSEIVAMLPLYERQKMGIRHLICPVMAYYQPLSFYHDPGAGDARKFLDNIQIMSGIAEFLAKRYSRMQFNLSPETSDIRAFTWSGMKAEPLYTFIHKRGEELNPVRDESEKLKKAAKRGYEYREKYAPKEFMTLLKSLYNRKGHRLGVSFERLESFIANLWKVGLLLQENLYLGDRIVSSDLVYTGSGTTAYAVMRATDPEEMQQGASSMHTRLMLENLLLRYEAVDFCGANIRDVARFKAALGLKLAVFYRITGRGGLL